MSICGHTKINIDSLKRWVNSLAINKIRNFNVEGHDYEIKNEMKKIFKEFDSIHSDMKKRVESDLNLPFYYPYIYFKQGTIVLN